MTDVEEKLALLARAILDIAANAARTWDYDGEQMVAEGLFLADEAALREMAERAK